MVAYLSCTINPHGLALAYPSKQRDIPLRLLHFSSPHSCKIHGKKTLGLIFFTTLPLRCHISALIPTGLSSLITLSGQSYCPISHSYLISSITNSHWAHSSKACLTLTRDRYCFPPSGLLDLFFMFGSFSCIHRRVSRALSALSENPREMTAFTSGGSHPPGIVTTEDLMLFSGLWSCQCTYVHTYIETHTDINP